MMTMHKNQKLPLTKQARVAVIEYRSHIMLLVMSGGSLMLSLAYFISRGF